MTKLTKFCLGAAFILTTGTSVFAQDAADPAPLSPDTVIATVNGIEITVGHMVLARAALDDQYRQFPAEVLFEGLREQLIQQTLLEQHLAEPPRELEFLLENERRRMWASEAAGQIADAAVTDEALQAAYDREFASAEPTKEYNASHILLASEEDALAALERVEAGESFADLARELSTGPSGPNGGQLGWFAPEQMVAPFSDAVVGMEVGGVAGPVQTQFGWHVITLNDSRDQPVPLLDEVRDDLTSEIRQDAAETAVKAMLADATIEMTEGLDAASVLDGSVFLSE